VVLLTERDETLALLEYTRPTNRGFKQVATRRWEMISVKSSANERQAVNPPTSPTNTGARESCLVQTAGTPVHHRSTTNDAT